MTVWVHQYQVTVPMRTSVGLMLNRVDIPPYLFINRRSACGALTLLFKPKPLYIFLDFNGGFYPFDLLALKIGIPFWFIGICLRLDFDMPLDGHISHLK